MGGGLSPSPSGWVGGCSCPPAWGGWFLASSHYWLHHPIAGPWASGHLATARHPPTVAGKGGGPTLDPPPHPPPASQRAAGGCLVLPVPPAVKIKLLDFTNLMRLTWLRYTFLLGLRADGCGTRRGQLAGGQAWGGGGVCVADVGCCPNVASQHTPGRDVP